MFLLLFSLCQMGGLERIVLEEGAISTTVQAKHQPRPWIERHGHYGSLVCSEIHCVKEDAVLILPVPGTLQRCLIKK